MQITHREERIFSDVEVGLKHVEHQTSHEDKNDHHDVRPAADQRDRLSSALVMTDSQMLTFPFHRPGNSTSSCQSG